VTTDILPSDYQAFLHSIKTRVQQAQLKAVVAVNKELIVLYWQIGKEILERQEKEGWGTKVIDRLSADLHAAFPQMNGFSIRNLKYMRSFAETYPDYQFVQEVLAQIFATSCCKNAREGDTNLVGKAEDQECGRSVCG
jgi:predicted nuclease of restriction endonuclease-like (RecB) superfamily